MKWFKQKFKKIWMWFSTIDTIQSIFGWPIWVKVLSIVTPVLAATVVDTKLCPLSGERPGL
jgi:hypothetical protein